MVAQTDRADKGSLSGVNGTPSNYVNNGYHYQSQYLGQPRPVRVIIIGAGLSGIAAVKIFKERFSGKAVEIVIYEKNEDVTGTWLENRYPGYEEYTLLAKIAKFFQSCSCDVPAHAYTFSWEGNPRWSKAYVGAVELFEYFKGRAISYGVNDFVQLRHRVVGCNWDDRQGKWSVKVEDLSSNTTFVDTAEVVINACGFLK